VGEELKAVFDPRGGAWMEGRYVPSLLAAIGDIIERHMIDIGFIPTRGSHRRHAEEMVEPARAVANLPAPSGGAGTDHGHAHPRMPECPKCGEAAIIRSEGCDQCTNCDYSKCG
jgi:ribonucleoside-diphosphate reductase alpha chain